MASETKNPQRLALVRGVHTFIYIVMATSTLLLVYAGLTGDQGWWLWVALGLLAVETVVFAGNGMKCPLTALAVSYGAEKGYAFDTFLPERAAPRDTFRFFGSLMLVGLVLLALRWLGLIDEVVREPLRTSRSGRNIRHGWNTRHARHCITLAPGVMSQRPSVPPALLCRWTSFS